MAFLWFLLGALFVSFIDGEFKFRWRQLARLMVRMAAWQMPAEHRERMREEWLAELEELEAEQRDGAQVGYALGLLWSVPTMKVELASEEEVRAMADVLSHRSSKLFSFLMKVAGPFMLLVSISYFLEGAQIAPVYTRWVSLPLGLVSFALGGVSVSSIYFSVRAEKLDEMVRRSNPEL